MAFKDFVAADASKVFINLGEFAEPATYNKKSISVIPEIGTDPKNGAAQATFEMLNSDLPTEINFGTDKIVHDGVIWYVQHTRAKDANITRLACFGEESPYHG